MRVHRAMIQKIEKFLSQDDEYVQQLKLHLPAGYYKNMEWFLGMHQVMVNLTNTNVFFSRKIEKSVIFEELLLDILSWTANSEVWWAPNATLYDLNQGPE